MKASIAISRASDDKVYIRLTDVTSGIEFAEVALSVEAFGYAVTGLASLEGDLTVRGLKYVGKRPVSERRQIECPLPPYHRHGLSGWLRENAKEEGWIVDTYLGSRGAVTPTPTGCLLLYTVTKYVDPEPTSAPPRSP